MSSRILLILDTLIPANLAKGFLDLVHRVNRLSDIVGYVISPPKSGRKGRPEKYGKKVNPSLPLVTSAKFSVGSTWTSYFSLFTVSITFFGSFGISKPLFSGNHGNLVSSQ